jgi:hypothetical protein
LDWNADDESEGNEIEGSAKGKGDGADEADGEEKEEDEDREEEEGEEDHRESLPPPERPRITWAS